MDAAASDEYALEFEIEVVSSSSNASLNTNQAQNDAPNQVNDLSFIGQIGDDAIKSCDFKDVQGQHLASNGPEPESIELNRSITRVVENNLHSKEQPGDQRQINDCERAGVQVDGSLSRAGPIGQRAPPPPAAANDDDDEQVGAPPSPPVDPGARHRGRPPVAAGAVDRNSEPSGEFVATNLVPVSGRYGSKLGSQIGPESVRDHLDDAFAHSPIGDNVKVSNSGPDSSGKIVCDEMRIPLKLDEQQANKLDVGIEHNHIKSSSATIGLAQAQLPDTEYRHYQPPDTRVDHNHQAGGSEIGSHQIGLTKRSIEETLELAAQVNKSEEQQQLVAAELVDPPRRTAPPCDDIIEPKRLVSNSDGGVDNETNEAEALRDDGITSNYARKSSTTNDYGEQVVRAAEWRLISESLQCPAGWLLLDQPVAFEIGSVERRPAASCLELAKRVSLIEPNGLNELTKQAEQSDKVTTTTSQQQHQDQEGIAHNEGNKIGQLTLIDQQLKHRDEMFDVSIGAVDDSASGGEHIQSPVDIEVELAPNLSLDISLPQKWRHSFSEDDDLEREFDEEPEFERRQVSVKRNRDPRDEYALGDELGRGKFGTVYRCTELASGMNLAAKFVHMRRCEDRKDVEREVAIMSILQHKRLLQLYDAFDDGLNQMCLITELVEGGELFERIVDDDFDLTEKKAAIFMRQICEGVEYMHSQNIVHLDMKPENILCMSRTGNRIKLIDFGLARQLRPDQPLRVMIGTPDFASPEVLAYETVTLATDMWSVGVICYVLLSGLSPFMGDNDMETMANVTKATYDFDYRAFEPISDLAKDFISKLLVREPHKRLKPSECLQHAWLQRGGAQLEAAVRERRESNVAMLHGRQTIEQVAAAFASASASPGAAGTTSSADTTASLVSLDKRNLKKYVVRRKWHKTVHAIMALGRMGANLKFRNL